jgi:hypothetical protein
MNSRSKTNNFIALLIAAILFATGFALYFAHQQLESREQVGQNQLPGKTGLVSVSTVEARLDTGSPVQHI